MLVLLVLTPLLFMKIYFLDYSPPPLKFSDFLHNLINANYFYCVT